MRILESESIDRSKIQSMMRTKPSWIIILFTTVATVDSSRLWSLPIDQVCCH